LTRSYVHVWVCSDREVLARQGHRDWRSTRIWCVVGPPMNEV
jgi:hypothetical protein